MRTGRLLRRALRDGAFEDPETGIAIEWRWADADILRSVDGGMRKIINSVPRIGLIGHHHRSLYKAFSRQNI